MWNNDDISVKKQRINNLEKNFKRETYTEFHVRRHRRNSEAGRIIISNVGYTGQL